MIEDDVAVADMYRMKLELDGYSVAVATGGEEGLRLASKLRPDLVYLDLRLPTMDGIEVLERLRSDRDLAATPVIILSNYGESETVARGLSLGALDHLIKAETTPAALSRRLQDLAKDEPTNDPDRQPSAQN